jgi:hypothetical protein
MNNLFNTVNPDNPVNQYYQNFNFNTDQENKEIIWCSDLTDLLKKYQDLPENEKYNIFIIKNEWEFTGPSLILNFESKFKYIPYIILNVKLNKNNLICKEDSSYYLSNIVSNNSTITVESYNESYNVSFINLKITDSTLIMKEVDNIYNSFFDNSKFYSEKLNFSSCVFTNCQFNDIKQEIRLSSCYFRNSNTSSTYTLKFNTNLYIKHCIFLNQEVIINNQITIDYCYINNTRIQIKNDIEIGIIQLDNNSKIYICGSGSGSLKMYYGRSKIYYYNTTNPNKTIICKNLDINKFIEEKLNYTENNLLTYYRIDTKSIILGL